MKETYEQTALVQWLKLKKLFYFAIPNGSVLRGTPLQRAKQMNVLKKEGLVVGASDIFVMLPSKLIAIELKQAKKVLKSGKLSTSHTKVSDDQKKFLERLNQFDYADGKVCYGFTEAKEFIEENL